MAYFKKEKSEFDSKTLSIDRVTRVVAGGKRFRFRALVAVGDRKGRVGIGIGKGVDVALAVEKATNSGKKHLVSFPVLNGTIPHAVTVKYAAARIMLRPGAKGRGLIAGGVVRPMCDLAGIRDINAKILSKSTNKINNSRAVLKAFKSLRALPQKINADSSNKIEN